MLCKLNRMTYVQDFFIFRFKMTTTQRVTVQFKVVRNNVGVIQSFQKKLTNKLLQKQ